MHPLKYVCFPDRRQPDGLPEGRHRVFWRQTQPSTTTSCRGCPVTWTTIYTLLPDWGIVHRQDCGARWSHSPGCLLPGRDSSIRGHVSTLLIETNAILVNMCHWKFSSASTLWFQHRKKCMLWWRVWLRRKSLTTALCGCAPRMKSPLTWNNLQLLQSEWTNSSCRITIRWS